MGRSEHHGEILLSPQVGLAMTQRAHTVELGPSLSISRAMKRTEADAISTGVHTHTY